MDNSEGEGYEVDFLSMVELLWGKGFIAPGGEGNVDRIVEGIDLTGKDVLEIGSGLGGGTMVLAGKYGARVLGLEIEAPLVERATQYAREAGLADRIEFRHVQPGAFPVADGSMDVFYNSGVLVHFEDKRAALADAYRILKPGGMVLGYDWLNGIDRVSEAMRHWLKVAGLIAFPDTLENYAAFLRDAGFEDVSTSDASDWYKQRAGEEYEQMTGPLYEKMAELANAEARDQLIEEWRALLVVLNNGELRSGYFRGGKP